MMKTREKGYFEKMVETWSEAGATDEEKITMEGAQKLLLILTMLAAGVILSNVFGGGRVENVIARWLFWIWMGSWAFGVIAIHFELKAKAKFEAEQAKEKEKKKLPRLR